MEVAIYRRPKRPRFEITDAFFPVVTLSTLQTYYIMHRSLVVVVEIALQLFPRAMLKMEFVMLIFL